MLEKLVRELQRVREVREIELQRVREVRECLNEFKRVRARRSTYCVRVNVCVRVYV